MKVLHYIIPLSLIMLFIINSYSSSQNNINFSSWEFSKGSKADYPSSKCTQDNALPTHKVNNEITVGETTVKTDKNEYKPGEVIKTTVESLTSEMNGSLEWQLESPVSEVAFDFYSNYQDIFSDASFSNPAITDWNNISFLSVDESNGYLNLTEEADLDLDDAEIFYNDFVLNNTRYRVSFDYLSQGENLLLNPGFEFGDTTGWEGSLTNVTVITAPQNASEGSNYLSINASEGFILWQNVSVKSGMVITFSARATGVNNANYWKLRLEAYNSSNTKDNKGFIETSVDSRSLTSDEKGYAFNKILRWAVPSNTSYLRAIFFGQDTGSTEESDGLYTGWLDGCILAQAPPNLLFSYWGDDQSWNNKSFDTGTHEWIKADFKINIGLNNPTNKTLRFILPDTNSFGNNATSYWLIDNIEVNLVTITTEKTYFLKSGVAGVIQSTWFHHGFRENLTSSYNIVKDNPINTSKADISISLPRHQVYFGSWIFVLIIHPQDKQSVALPDIKINISFVIKEQMNFVVQNFYVLRGSTNKTIDNASVFTEYFEKEPYLQTISPGDNITVLGYLEANSTKNEFYNLDYIRISTAKSDFHWNSTSVQQEDIKWSVFGFIPYNKEGMTILDGNFTSPYNNTQTIAINFQIPLRGIYGNVSANISLTISSTNIKDGNVGGLPVTLIIPIDIPIVKYRVEVLSEKLPETTYYLTEYLEGNITVETKNYNNSLESIYQDRNITSVINIPIKDIDLTIFLDDLNTTPSFVEISQDFKFHYIGNTIIWLSSIKPTLLAGTYDFKIRWNSPYKLGIVEQAYLNISILSIEIKGTLGIIPPDTIPQIIQGGQKTLNFTVRVNETLKLVGGLNLIARILENISTGYLIVYEEDGLYKIDLDIETDTPPQIYTVDILVNGRDVPIGKFSFEVTKLDDPSEENGDPLMRIIDLVGFAFFGFVGIGFIVILLLANKSLK